MFGTTLGFTNIMSDEQIEQTRRELGLTKPGKDIPVDRGVDPKISDYNSHGVKTRPPAAAKFGVGASSLPEINDALDQRRAHNEALSDPSRKGFEKQSPNS
jgi:hypothetical protein